MDHALEVVVKFLIIGGIMGRGSGDGEEEWLWWWMYYLWKLNDEPKNEKEWEMNVISEEKKEEKGKKITNNLVKNLIRLTICNCWYL